MPAIETDSLPLPGAARLRNLMALDCGDCGCPLLCDLERGAVMVVPLEFQLHLAEALETGDPDEELLGWLMSAGLLTTDGPDCAPAGRPRRGAMAAPPRATGSLIRIPLDLIHQAITEMARPPARDDSWGSIGRG